MNVQLEIKTGYDADYGNSPFRLEFLLHIPADENGRIPDSLICKEFIPGIDEMVIFDQEKCGLKQGRGKHVKDGCQHTRVIESLRGSFDSESELRDFIESVKCRLRDYLQSAYENNNSGLAKAKRLEQVYNIEIEE